MKKNENKQKQAGYSKKKIGTAFLSIAITIMLTAGIGLSQFNTAKIVTQTTGSTAATTEIVDPCPCHQKQKGQNGQINYDIPVYTPCSIIIDPLTGEEYSIQKIYEIARPILASYAATVGCPGNAQGQSQQSQQSGVIIQNKEIGFDSIGGAPQTPGSIQKEQITGLNETEVLQRITEMDAWMYSDCGSGVPAPDYGWDGGWHVGPAMMVCLFVGLRLVGVGFAAASMLAVGTFAKLCNLGMYLALLWEFGIDYGQVAMQAYVDCVEVLTGGQ